MSLPPIVETLKTLPELEIPLGIKAAIESGECVLFIGAGVGNCVLDQNQKPLPNGKELAQELAQHFHIDTEEDYDLAKVAQTIELRKGRSDLETFVRKRLTNVSPDNNFLWLFQQKWKAIYTTNYDNAIQRAYELIPSPKQIPVFISITSEIVPINNNFQVPIFQIHGSLFGAGKPYIIITENDYATFSKRRKMLFDLLKHDFLTSTILYVGYSNSDYNWKLLLNDIATEFYPSPLPKSYRIAPRTSKMDLEILQSKGIETINCSLEDFVLVASRSFEVNQTTMSYLAKKKENIPVDLIQAFDKSPATVIRFLSAWDYVNFAKFYEKSNVFDFLRGDRPNWGLIGSRDHFERDIEEDLYNEILDFLTGSQKSQNIKLVLGSAGYGVSTLLMSIAAKLVNEKVKPVFMLKPGQTLIEGDIEFAISLFSTEPIFIIDNAADFHYQIHNCAHKLKEAKRTALFLLGARLNEWRQVQPLVKAKEFIIEPLSDDEIDRLLQCLQKHDELNTLKALPYDMQFSAVKQLYKQELLVALREATEGKSFDAILEDEFRKIGDANIKKLYLYVCCFYQNGAYLRDMLLPNLVELSNTDIYPKVKNFADGIIKFDCLDETNQIYGLRARHRTIATIVWERCSTTIEKSDVPQKSLSSLNLNHKTDKDAFEQFIRSDRLVDNMKSFEAKTKFFEEACRKEPLSAYVRQHYSRMLLRANQFDLALSQIEEAIRLNPRVRILHHTKGHILAQLAIKTESFDIARRIFANSESSYKKGISLFNKDEYCYQGLAHLYFEWGKNKTTSPEEAAEFISKAEETINEGLKIVDTREGLWIESSYIQKWLNGEPAQLQALEKAVTENPRSVISRYLLGRTYRKVGRYADAIKILEPIIKDHHDEFRPFIEYALSLICQERDIQEGYRKGLAILQLSTLYGLSDPRYIATLGGLYTMTEQHSKAAEIHQQAVKHNFNTQELNALQFFPPDPVVRTQNLKLRGTVSVVKPKYSLIQPHNFPRILCPHSKINNLILKEGMRIEFELAFAARGSVANNPVQI